MHRCRLLALTSGFLIFSACASKSTPATTPPLDKVVPTKSLNASGCGETPDYLADPFPMSLPGVDAGAVAQDPSAGKVVSPDGTMTVNYHLQSAGGGGAPLPELTITFTTYGGSKSWSHPMTEGEHWVETVQTGIKSAWGGHWGVDVNITYSNGRVQIERLVAVDWVDGAEGFPMGVFEITWNPAGQASAMCAWDYGGI